MVHMSFYYFFKNHIASSVVVHRLVSWCRQTKDYKIGICCFYAKNAALRRNRKDWLAWNQYNVSSSVTCLPVDYCFSELAL
ncbi:hypothetical protein BAZSYMA_ACONTIG41858_2 [Bathymodiolus azoricus thioautotrophic gill symbiont]|uniref:Uncharacterized protein n=1 Tax=Bathymodiolus azoricus thioautotrophic gill symbiont TaxID=235205 RepID=A0A1H6M4B8_9GAMM|nr:hypothetical protein BAZSYMA_ACONTIG41858_2 [Bathymodiolus azoricus thioautotrophic gill symbiont]